MTCENVEAGGHPGADGEWLVQPPGDQADQHLPAPVPHLTRHQAVLLPTLSMLYHLHREPSWNPVWSFSWADVVADQPYPNMNF